jgi:hypothetical protein
MHLCLLCIASGFCLLCFLLFPCAGDPHCAVRCAYVVLHAACLFLVQCFAICTLPCEPGVIHPSMLLQIPLTGDLGPHVVQEVHPCDLTRH